MCDSTLVLAMTGSDTRWKDSAAGVWYHGCNSNGSWCQGWGILVVFQLFPRFCICTVGLLSLVGNVNFTVIITVGLCGICMQSLWQNFLNIVCVREIYIHIYLLSLLFFQGREMSSKLQVDVCHYSHWWRHLVNAYRVHPWVGFVCDSWLSMQLTTSYNMSTL